MRRSPRVLPAARCASFRSKGLSQHLDAAERGHPAALEHHDLRRQLTQFGGVVADIDHRNAFVAQPNQIGQDFLLAALVERRDGPPRDHIPGPARIRDPDPLERAIGDGPERRLYLAADVPLRDGGTYWQTIGPRLETAAEIRLIAAHADVVGMTLGAECVIGRDAFIDTGVEIGDRVKIQNGALVYHGVTVAAGSLTGLPAIHKDFALPIAGILHTDCPHYWKESEPGESEEPVALRRAVGQGSGR